MILLPDVVRGKVSNCKNVLENNPICLLCYPKIAPRILIHITSRPNGTKYCHIYNLY